MVKVNKIEIIPEAIIADISVHALIRHQNQRRIKISPVPAPNIKIISKSCKAFVNDKATRELTIIKITVVILPIFTKCFSVASGFTCCL